MRDGRYCVKSPLLAFTKRGLWRILAYLDRFSERKDFLSGLLDAEAAISPHLNSRWKTFTIQITFGNTDRELADFVYNAFKELGLNPRMRTVQGRRHVINGKVVVDRKPLYMVHAMVPLDSDALKRIELHCRRKRLLIQFFQAVKDWPAQLRYEAFLRCWRKEGGKWVPACSDPLEHVKLMLPEGQPPQRPKRRRKVQVVRKYIIRCPKCWQEGVFRLHNEGNQIQFRVAHISGECVIYTAKVEGKDGFIKCEICEEPGRLFIFPDRRDECLRITVRHYINRNVRRMCPLMRLSLIREERIQIPKTRRRSENNETGKPTPNNTQPQTPPAN